MALPTSLFFLSISALAHAQYNTTQQRGVEWGECSDEYNAIATAPIQCGTLAVPLDYMDPDSNRTIDIELLKVNATQQPPRGSILFNPGGPGGSGLDLVAPLAQYFLLATGGEHDLIGFNPRGVGNTLPFSCFANEADREIGVRIVSETTYNSSDTAPGTLFAQSQLLAAECRNQSGDIGSFLGTAFVARDMLEISEAIDDGLLRYWGMSYGTVLGSTFAAMFPDKVDRLVLDGVVNSHEWYAGRDVQIIDDVDLVWQQGFFGGCLELPERCALAQAYPNATASELQEMVENFMFEIKYDPIAIASSNILLDYASLKTLTFSTLYTPFRWPRLATMFTDLLDGNTTSFEQFIAIPGPGSFGIFEPFSGIRCGDSTGRTENRGDLDPTLEALQNESSFWWEFPFSAIMYCSQWTMQPAERYDGPFTAQTRAPILFVSNSYDPVTPISSGRNMSAGFPGSVVLEQNGYGHGSIAQSSECTRGQIAAYFVNGTLPASGTICPVDLPVFADPTAGRSDDSNTTQKRMAVDEGKRIRDIVQALSRRRSEYVL